MSKFNTVQTNFLSGELGPKSFGRIESREYYQGSEIMENWLPLINGGVVKRPAFMMPGNDPDLLFDILANNSFVTKTIPFVIDQAAAVGTYGVYLVPTGPSHAKKLLIYSFSSVSGAMANVTWAYVTGSDLDSTTMDTADYDNYVQLNDYLIMFDTTGVKRPLVLTRRGDNTFHLAYMDEFPIHNESTPSTDLTFTTQFMHRPYLPKNIDFDKKLKSSATSGTVTLSAQDNAAGAIDFFVAEHVGAYFKLSTSASTMVLLVTAYTNKSSVTATVQQNGFALGGFTAATDDWQESSWSDAQGWPKCGAFWQDRLILGGNIRTPDAFWCSRNRNAFFFMQNKLDQDSSTDVSGLNFFGAVNDSDPFDLRVGGRTRSNISWISAERSLTIGTNTAEYLLSIGSEGLSYRSYKLHLNSTSGGSGTNVNTDQGVFFINQDGKKIHKLVYQEAIDRFKNSDITELNDEILNTVRVEDGVIASTAYVQGRSYGNDMVWDSSRKTIWMLAGGQQGAGKGGGLISITFQGDNNFAFSKHYIEGYSFQSIAIFPTNGVAAPVLNAVIKKGSVSHIVNMPLDRQTTNVDDSAAQNFLSSIIPYCDLGFYKDINSLGDLSAITGLVITMPWLSNGQTFELWADGYQIDTYVYNGVSFTLPAAYDQFCIGVPIGNTIKSIPFETRSLFGEGMPTIKRIDTLVFRLFKSQYLTFGSELTQMDDVTIEILDDVAFTGTSEQHRIDMAHGTSNQFFLSSNKAGPCTILAVGIKGELSD